MSSSVHFNSYYPDLNNVELTAPPDLEKVFSEHERAELLEPVNLAQEDVEEEITTAWGNFKENWWRIHNDEDESDSKELKEAKKRLPIGKKQYVALVGTILGSLGLQVAFRDEPIMKGTAGASINAIKISYNQIRQGTTPKYVMRAIAIATFIAGITLYYVPEDPHGVIRILRAAPLTDMFMTIILKCDLSSARLDQLLTKIVKKCTNKELPERLAKAITKAFFAIVGGSLMNIPQYSGPFVAAGAAVLAKANMRGVIDTLYQSVEDIESGTKQKAAIAAILGTCTAFAAASAYALSEPAVRQSGWAWAPAALLVVAGDTIARTVKNGIKTCTIPKEYKAKVKKEIEAGRLPPEPPTPWWKKGLTVVNGVGLVAATGLIAYVVGPATLSAAPGQTVATNSGILTTVCQEMSSLLKIAAGKLLPDSVALYGSLAMLTASTGYHLFKTISHSLFSPVAEATIAAATAAVVGVAAYELKDVLRAEVNPDYKKKKKKKKPKEEAVELQEVTVDPNVARM